MKRIGDSGRDGNGKCIGFGRAENGCSGINEAMKNSFNMGFNACIDEILERGEAE